MVDEFPEERIVSQLLSCGVRKESEKRRKNIRKPCAARASWHVTQLQVSGENWAICPRASSDLHLPPQPLPLSMIFVNPFRLWQFSCKSPNVGVFGGWEEKRRRGVFWGFFKKERRVVREREGKKILWFLFCSQCWRGDRRRETKSFTDYLFQRSWTRRFHCDIKYTNIVFKLIDK